MKKCTKCLREDVKFSKNKNTKSGFNLWCKECSSQNHQRYFRSKPGVVSFIYKGQVTSSKRRGHVKPQYSKAELQKWMFSQGKFHKIYDEWVNSNYEKDKKPSVDRINDYKPYSFKNIQITTWKTNRENLYRDKKMGRNNKISKSVKAVSIDGSSSLTFYSLQQASRETGTDSAHISKCCNGKLRSSGGFFGEFI